MIRTAIEMVILAAATGATFIAGPLGNAIVPTGGGLSVWDGVDRIGSYALLIGFAYWVIRHELPRREKQLEKLLTKHDEIVEKQEVRFTTALVEQRNAGAEVMGKMTVAIKENTTAIRELREDMRATRSDKACKER